MFRKHIFKVLTVFAILLFSAVWAWTHSGRTDKYGGHYNRKTGTYHYHNSGTVRRSTTPSVRSATPPVKSATPTANNVSKTQIPVLPYPTNDFNRDIAYPIKEINRHSIKVDINGKVQTITLMGVRARDGGAEEFLKRLLIGESVYIRFDKNGNKSQVYLFRAPDGLFVNLEMLRQGYSIVWSTPNFDNLALFTQYESVAKAAKKGIWKPKPKEIEVKTLWD